MIYGGGVRNTFVLQGMMPLHKRGCVAEVPLPWPVLLYTLASPSEGNTFV